MANQLRATENWKGRLEIDYNHLPDEFEYISHFDNGKVFIYPDRSTAKQPVWCMHPYQKNVKKAFHEWEVPDAEPSLVCQDNPHVTVRPPLLGKIRVNVPVYEVKFAKLYWISIHGYIISGLGQRVKEGKSDLPKFLSTQPVKLNSTFSMISKLTNVAPCTISIPCLNRL